jgi:hypothetical protein
MIITLDSDCGPVSFEVDDRSSGAVRGVGSSKLDHLSERLDAALLVVGRVAEGVRQALRNVDVGSAEVTIGVKLTAEAGFVVAKTAAEATISVKIALDQRSIDGASKQ